MDTYTFYGEHTDIEALAKCELLKDFPKFFDSEFLPPYLEVSIPPEEYYNLANIYKDYVIDPTSPFTPSKILAIANCNSADKRMHFIGKYNALSYIEEDGVLYLNIPCDI